MAFISLTRLRIRSVRFLPGFALHAWRTGRQARAAPGFLDGALLPDRALTFWTLTVWDEEASMRSYRSAGAHRAAMPKLLEWCDEASVAHWQQAEASLPGWAEADRCMREIGRPSKVRHPSPVHATLGYREPRLSGSVSMRPIRPSPRRRPRAEG